VTPPPPQDQLAADLIKMYSPADASATTPTSTPSEFEEPAYPMQKLDGAG
jgi:hypothetical protein